MLAIRLPVQAPLKTADPGSMPGYGSLRAAFLAAGSCHLWQK